MIGALGFSAAWVLAALAVLPALWWLLRVVPPQPRRVYFPALIFLLGLTDKENDSAKTPWWLLMLRLMAAGFLILALSGPVVNPPPSEGDETPQAPLVILRDGGWASALDWSAEQQAIEANLRAAIRDGRAAVVISLTEQPQASLEALLTSGDEQIMRLSAMRPAPFAPDYAAWSDWFAEQSILFDGLWFSDGLAHGSERAGLAELLAARAARLRVIETGDNLLRMVALAPLEQGGDGVTLRLLRAQWPALPTARYLVQGFGPDPSGVPRVLVEAEAVFEEGAVEANLALTLPPELRNRLTRFEVAGQPQAAARLLIDDSLARREIGLVASNAPQEGQALLSPFHYLREALSPNVDLIEGGLAEILPANPDVIILVDVTRLPETEQSDLTAWVEQGGLLLRFAGPRMAALSPAEMQADALMPVQLRQGGRALGGAMSWADPRKLNPFPETSPFFGLAIPDEVTVSQQVLAQPGPDLAARSLAALEDGTPLVTQMTRGAGRVVLFHVTANAEWSNLPLSGLFVQMLERLSVYTRPISAEGKDYTGLSFVSAQVLDGFGALYDAQGEITVAGEDLQSGALSADMPPGLYQTTTGRVALNVIKSAQDLTLADWPENVSVIRGLSAPPTPLAPWLFLLALIALAADMIGSLAVTGRLPVRAKAALFAVVLMAPFAPSDAQTLTPEDMFGLMATEDLRLAYVVTGDDAVDEISRAGLQGLSDTLWARTTIEPSPPVGVELTRDELAFFPLLYWPVTEGQNRPSDDVYQRLNAYLRGGGMIVFDTRDGDLGGIGGATPAARRLQDLAQGLDIPPLAPIPEDHVLTRAFYLLADFPGRYTSRDIWVEAAPPEPDPAEGMPFRALNDGVSPVIIGGNDWAAAWAVDGAGRPLLPIGRGYAGERQREIALRFGVNLVMHVLSGNYKSDQVHVPALLQRLGN